MKLPVDYTTIDQRTRRLVREEYVRIQSGNCSYCKKPLNAPAQRTLSINKSLFPNGFFKWPVHLHHDHKTGMTIGAVHNYCNAVLWQYEGE